MAFIFTCGTHTFQKLLKGYENVTVQCGRCGNWSCKICTKWEWFTFCFVPIIPFSLKPYRLIKCHICPFETNVENSDDAVRQMQQIDQGGVPMQPPQQQQPHGGPHQGWNAGNPYGGQPNMSGGAGGGQYQQPQGMPQYK
ncbi:hypothetical protein CB0940_11951 [Cercospora beticola]|uniref:Zinc-ribbon 15 domain-containing protein n=1 Tax=Cercospora beticola TaxID=122368 RepID=A0A2G5IEZ0_CERBT|nr:hypothetical protein CB0940_11951 [Cercospora beticola]PIB03084.1 hypothetical protein CB0940_11951 [Cercospora beticola]WPB04318.1 hypothetical protein RHO25_008964 [Cercospora beticola]CAK1356865.1 unnamed protein product [Cercospora beticola]